MVTPNELGRRIRLAREEAELSQEELGKLLQPPRSHAAISDMERGITMRVGATEIAQLARILKKPRAYFYDDEDTRSRPASAQYARGDAAADIDDFKRHVDEILGRRRKDQSE